jgi:hypothetical protein
MADLFKIKREANAMPGAPPMPPAPSPDFGMDIPAPAPPVKPDETGWMETPPEPIPRAAPRKEAPLPMPAASSGGLDSITPFRLPQTGGKAAMEEATEAVGIHGSPPVFIKIDKYTDIVKNLQRLKSYAMNLRDALDALADIEKELTTGISISHKALDDFNTTIAILDSKLLRASAIKDFDAENAGDMDKYIKGIYDQMEKIKSELKSIG